MLNAVVIVLVVDPDNEAAALLHVMVITENAIFLSSSEPSGFLRRHTVSEVPRRAPYAGDAHEERERKTRDHRPRDRLGSP
jgi:hypothetical protein